MKIDACSQSESPQTPKIAIIGGGLGGICAGIQLEKQLGLKTYTIFDENHDFGGTWLVNSYPGAACDIESSLYSFSFELNPNWTKNYATQSEIHAYIVRVAQKYGLYEHARFSTMVNSLEWLEAEGKWEVKFLDKTTQKIHSEYFDYTIWAVGALRAPFIPSEFTNFKGKIIHSAEWQQVDLKNKRVGIVGSGASAIQIIPAIAPKVKELHSYQRTPSWVITRLQYDVPTFIQNLFVTIPILMWIVRTITFIVHEFMYFAFQTDSLLNSFVSSQAKYYIKRQVSDQETQKKLLPDYQLGCKRILISENYYRTFNQPNVRLHREKIVEISGNTIRTNGNNNSQELDILILATGFRVQDFFAPLQITGRGKWNLLPQWKKQGPTTFYGLMTSDAPNAFMIAGPNTILGHNSVIFMIESQCDFIVQVIAQAILRGTKAVTVKRSAEDKWMEQMKKDMKTTIWQSGGCNAWYTDSRGEVTILWPKNCTSYWRETRKVNFNNMHWTY